MASFSHLSALGIVDRVKVWSASITDLTSVIGVIADVQADEIYNLAGQSSVALSFEQPIQTIDSVVFGTINVLEAVRLSQRPIRFYSAGSSEAFGDTDGTAASETTPFRPRSPYGVGKAAAFWAVAQYRQAYGLHACTGILFNHESPFRAERFVTKKIVAAAVRIARDGGRLRLGNLDIARDWGWAPEYVTAMWRMLQQDTPEDYVVATGETHSLREFVAHAFATVGLDWRDHVDADPTLLRPSEILINRADPSKAARCLNWTATVTFREIIRRLVDAEQQWQSRHWG